MADLSDPIDVAGRLFAAIEAGDVEAVGALYADDIEVWHNHDRRVQTRDENLRVLRWLVREFEDVRYEEVRREATASGFVQQHVLAATRRDGVRVEVPACVVVRVEGGRIVRIDEYLDSASVDELVAR